MSDTTTFTVAERAASQFARLFPAEVAANLETCRASDAAEALERLALEDARQVFQRLTPSAAADVLANLSVERAASLLTWLETPRAASLSARLSSQDVAAVLDAANPAAAREIRQLMAYPPATAGRLMDPRITLFRPEMTTGQALERLRQATHRQIFNLFVVDTDAHLIGAVTLAAVALAPQSVRLDSLMQPPTAVADTAGRDEVVETMERNNLVSMPVTDFDQRVVGVIRLDSLVDAVQREASADMQMMVGAGAEERALSSVGMAVRKRLPWLQINLLTAFLAASVVGLFEQTIATYTALAVLLPVVAGQSGNTGAQALAVTLRGLALREVTPRQWLKVSIKELGAGAANGLAVAAVTCAGVFVWSRSVGLTIVIGIAMVLAMAIAGVAGAAVPMLLSAIGQDPAQSSSIVLTTVTDIFGFFSFLGLATLFSSML